MPTPRRSIISLEDTPYYHCCSRVVRRAFLCGYDDYSGKSYEHRRDWVEQQILRLTDVFAIDVAAFAVMSNHLHVVLHVDVNKANSWSDKEVIEHWHRNFKGSKLTKQFLRDEFIPSENINNLKHLVATYRTRLSDISWFMRCLNEPIARMANAEDNCTGRFWEGRFKSQALLDEKALLACMAYVDLNPIRAKIAKTPEKSDYTSLKLRINAAIEKKQPEKLLPFLGKNIKHQAKGLPFFLEDYLSLVNITGRVIRQRKNFIDESQLPILNSLNISLKNWLKITASFGELFHGPVGDLQKLTTYCKHLSKRRRHFTHCCQFFETNQ